MINAKDEKEITIDRVKTFMDRLLKVTHSLAESHPKAHKKFYYLRVLEGFYRRCVFTFLAVRYLSDAPSLADSATVLSRKMLEDVISIEYMILKGKEEMAKRFQDFFYIQAYQEIEQRKRLKYDIPSERQMQILHSKVEKLKPQYWHEKSGSFMRSWSGKDAEQMWIELAKAKAFQKDDIQRVLLGYTYGSWKNHPNPADNLTYMTDKLRKDSARQTLMQAAILSMMCFIRLTNRYIDEIRIIMRKNVYEDVNVEIKKIFNRLDR